MFDTNLLENSTSLKPENQNELSSELKFVLNHEEYILNRYHHMRTYNWIIMIGINMLYLIMILIKFYFQILKRKFSIQFKWK